MATAIASASSSTSKPTIGILSIGEMGMGIAKVLRANDYVVCTNAAGRSKHTTERIKAVQIIAYDSDEALVAEADIILSIVPPRDAVATSKRVLEASRKQATIKQRAERRGGGGPHTTPPTLTQEDSSSPLLYFDLNAISPRTSRGIAALLSSEPATSPPPTRRLSNSFSFRRPSSSAADSPPELKPIPILYVDGGIIGPPPTFNSETQSWKQPSIILSGPTTAKSDDDYNHLLTPPLLKTLNAKSISPDIGAASTLKCCFASLTKGLTALSILSFTTAHTSGVLPELQSHLKDFSPNTLALVERGLAGMPPKAYRWVDEMRQIGETFSDEGGFASPATSVSTTSTTSTGSAVFDAIAELYRFVAEDTALAAPEKSASSSSDNNTKRKRGLTAEDVAEGVAQGIKAKRRKAGGEDEKLELAWRGSWS